jgi:hypothetical protein
MLLQSYLLLGLHDSSRAWIDATRGCREPGIAAYGPLPYPDPVPSTPIPLLCHAVIINQRPLFQTRYDTVTAVQSSIQLRLIKNPTCSSCKLAYHLVLRPEGSLIISNAETVVTRPVTRLVPDPCWAQSVETENCRLETAQYGGINLPLPSRQPSRLILGYRA